MTSAPERIRDIMSADMISAVRAAAAITQDLLFPRRCPFCDQPVRPFGALACPECSAAVHRISPRRDVLCCRCGKPLKDEGAEYCRECLKESHAYRRGCAVYRYRELSGPIYRFKYERRAEYAEFFGRAMAQRFLEEFDPAYVDALIPVPLSKERLAGRGWNQAQLLADVLGRQIHVPVRTDILIRRESTQALRGAGARERRANLKRAFHVTGDDVKSKVYVLVDDIYTTGATIDACSRELLRAGAGGIFFITLAIGNDEGV